MAPDLFFGRYTHHAALTEIFVSDAVTITNPRGLLHQGGTALREFIINDQRLLFDRSDPPEPGSPRTASD